MIDPATANCRTIRRQRHSRGQETLGVAAPPTCLLARPGAAAEPIASSHRHEMRLGAVLRLIKTRRDVHLSHPFHIHAPLSKRPLVCFERRLPLCH